MTSPELLKDYCAYNQWANARIYEWLIAQPVELFDRELASSFPSLRLTTTHIWGAQDVWLRRLKGESPTQFIANTFNGNATEAVAGVLQSSEDFKAFIANQPDEFFNTAMDYKDLSGNAFHNTVADVILHCMQHSTYHRGQLVTMARTLGITDPPKTDYIVFARLKGA
jgi:uncharacterized damage-inducible protein DinB